MSPEQEELLLKIAKLAAKNCRLTDKDEAYSIALVGVAKGMASYKETTKTKLTTYLYRCAQFECWAEWRRLHRIKRNRGIEAISIDYIHEQGGDI